MHRYLAKPRYNVTASRESIEDFPQNNACSRSRIHITDLEIKLILNAFSEQAGKKKTSLYYNLVTYLCDILS